MGGPGDQQGRHAEKDGNKAHGCSGRGKFGALTARPERSSFYRQVPSISVAATAWVPVVEVDRVEDATRRRMAARVINPMQGRPSESWTVTGRTSRSSRFMARSAARRSSS